METTQAATHTQHTPAPEPVPSHYFKIQCTADAPACDYSSEDSGLAAGSKHAHEKPLQQRPEEGPKEAEGERERERHRRVTKRCIASRHRATSAQRVMLQDFLRSEGLESMVAQADIKARKLGKGKLACEGFG